MKRIQIMGYNFRQRMARFLYGRYGADSLYNALFVTELILLFVSTVLNFLGTHLLPFDGVADWNGIAARLKKANYAGDFTFELTSKNKPERHTHDIYADLDYTAFATLAFEKAKKFKELMLG